MHQGLIIAFVAACSCAGAVRAQAQPQPQPQSQPQAQPQAAPQPQALQATGCENLRAQVEARIASSGVARFTVTVVDAAASAPGRVVGTCDKGASKLLYVQQASGAPRGPRPQLRADQPMLTECKDGTVTLGDCKSVR